ncbi:MAG: hypothetical protein ACOYBW_07070 [Fluviibacter phosphoraccumulans]
MTNVNTTAVNTTATAGLNREQIKKAVAAASLKFSEATVQKLDALSDKRDAWEQGAFKKANDELYGLLADTLELFQASEDTAENTKVKAHGKEYMSKLRVELTTRLGTLGVKVQKNSSTLTMLVRYVFKSDRKRAHGYSQVLGAAIQDGIKPADLANYIANAGGVEEIKRRMVLSADAIAKREQIANATNSVKADVELAALNPIASVQLATEGEYAVLLAKPSADGFVNIIGVLPEVNEALFNALLLRMAKKRVADGVVESVGQMTDAFAVPEAANDAAMVKHG